MKMYIYPYSLVPRIVQLNSVTTSNHRQGALLKIEGESGISYADFHNNEDFINMGLFDLKRYFKQEQMLARPFSLQWQQSLKMAECMTLQAPQLSSVNSHYLIQNVQEFDPLDLLKLETLNFKRFKVKMGRSLRAETLALRKLMNKSDFKTQFRLDFNESIAKKEFIIWFDKNKDLLQKKIEFIEDPIKWNPSQWQHIQNKYKVKLALDMAADPLSITASELPQVLILKPAVQSVDLIVDKFVDTEVLFSVTHFMDHPLGQLGANFIAQKLKSKLGDRVLDGGLMGFSMYEKNEFSEIRFSGQTAVPTKVFSKPHWGMGFILEKLNWIEV